MTLFAHCWKSLLQHGQVGYWHGYRVLPICTDIAFLHFKQTESCTCPVHVQDVRPQLALAALYTVRPGSKRQWCTK